MTMRTFVERYGRVAAASTFALLCVIVAVVVWRRESGGTPAVVRAVDLAPPVAPLPKNSTRFDTAQTEEGIRIAVERVAEQAASQAPQLGGGEPLSDAMAYAMAHVYTPDLARFEKRIADVGIKDHYLYKYGADWRKTDISSRAESFAGYAFDAAEVTVVVHYANGVQISPTPQPSGATGTSKHGQVWLADPAGYSLTAVEVRVPSFAMLIPSRQAARVTHGLWFGKVKGMDKWYLFKSSVYDLPNLTGVIHPAM